MNKMSSFETNHFFDECQQFAELLKRENQDIAELLRKPDQAELQRVLRSNDELIMLAKWRLEQLLEASENANWWGRRLAKRYIKQISHLFQHNQWGIKLLKDKTA